MFTTSVNIKPTNTLLYLHFISCHSEHTKCSLPYSLALTGAQWISHYARSYSYNKYILQAKYFSLSHSYLKDVLIESNFLPVIHGVPKGSILCNSFIIYISNPHNILDPGIKTYFFSGDLNVSAQIYIKGLQNT